MCETCEDVTKLQRKIIGLPKDKLPLALDLYEQIKATLPGYQALKTTLADGNKSIPFEHFIGGSTDQSIPHERDPLVDAAVSEINKQLIDI